jgi:hypothetical protein
MTRARGPQTGTAAKPAAKAPAKSAAKMPAAGSSAADARRTRQIAALRARGASATAVQLSSLPGTSPAEPNTLALVPRLPTTPYLAPEPGDQQAAPVGGEPTATASGPGPAAAQDPPAALQEQATDAVEVPHDSAAASAAAPAGAGNAGAVEAGVAPGEGSDAQEPAEPGAADPAVADDPAAGTPKAAARVARPKRVRFVPIGLVVVEPGRDEPTAKKTIDITPSLDSAVARWARAVKQATGKPGVASWFLDAVLARLPDEPEELIALAAAAPPELFAETPGAKGLKIRASTADHVTDVRLVMQEARIKRLPLWHIYCAELYRQLRALEIAVLDGE